MARWTIDTESLLDPRPGSFFRSPSYCTLCIPLWLKVPALKKTHPEFLRRQTSIHGHVYAP